MQTDTEKMVLTLNPDAYPEYSKSLRLSPFGYIEKLQRAIENSDPIADDPYMIDQEIKV